MASPVRPQLLNSAVFSCLLQETPLLYTPYLQWHHPGGRALLQLAQAPTQDYRSYTHTLLGVVEDHVVSPNDPPVSRVLFLVGRGVR